jgi:hypothetical protein
LQVACQPTHASGVQNGRRAFRACLRQQTDG